MNVMQTLQAFWSGFGLPAYDENIVPDNATLPYITYEGASDFYGSTRTLTASLWYYDTSWKNITELEMLIADYIGRGGRMIAIPQGALWIKRGEPWAQRMSDPSDKMIRRIVLNIEVDFVV